MRWIKAPRNRQRQLNVNRNPVPEIEALLDEVTPQEDIPPREVINENRAARFQHADAFIKPFLAPHDILFVRPIVVHAKAIRF